MLPKDPAMLLSLINMKLRDYYSDLDQLCEDMQVSRGELEARLEQIDYRYDRESNRFV